MIPCEDYLESISLLADGCLEGDAARSLEEHLAVCPECSARLEAFSALRETMSGWEETPPDTLAPGILYKIGLEKKAGRSVLWRRLAPLGAVAAVLLLVFALESRLPKDSAPENKALLFGSEEAAQDMLFMAGEDDGLEQATEDAPASGGTEGSWGATYRGEAEQDAGTDLNDEAGGPVPTQAPEATGKTAETFSDISAAPDGVSNIAANVRLNSNLVPDTLSGYTQTDRGDRIEIVIPAELFDELWPEWEAQGAVLETEDGLAQKNTSDGEAGAVSPAAEDGVLVIVYK